MFSASPGTEEDVAMKSTLSLLALLVLLLGGGTLAAAPGDPAPDAPAAQPTDGGQDGEHAITILLPELEKRLGKLEGIDTASTQDLAGALSVARGYQKLGLYEEASKWYERLEHLNGAELFADAIFNGRLAMAVGSGDADSLRAIILQGGPNVADPDATLLTRAFTEVGRRGDWNQVGELVKTSLSLYGDKVPADLLYLQGRALRRQNRLAEAVLHFERQLNAMKVPDAVHPSVLSQKGRFLRAAADCSFLMNDQLRARGLYQRLAVEGEPNEREWGRFQIAQMDMLANDYPRAERVFRAIAADSLGTLAELWAAPLAQHCAEMQAQSKYYVSSSPRLSAKAGVN